MVSKENLIKYSYLNVLFAVQSDASDKKLGTGTSKKPKQFPFIKETRQETI